VAFAFAAADLMIELDGDHRIKFASGAAKQLTGRDAEKLIGTPFADILSPQDQRLSSMLMRQLEKNPRIHPTSVRMAATERSALLGGCHLPGTAEETFYITLAGVSFSGMENLGDAQRDNAAGVLGKDDFGALARDLVNEAKVTGAENMMTLLDLPGAENIVDGSPLSDALADVGAFLRAQSVGGDAVGQIAPDKFGVIHNKMVDPKDLERQVVAISQERDPFGKGFEVEGHGVALDAATLNDEEIAGVLIYTINKFAEARDGGFTIESLSHGVKGLAKDTAERVSSLKKTLSERDFDIVFQPIVDLDSNEIHHYEVLTRFAKGESPQETIIFAEDTGLIEQLDLSVCQKAIAVIKDYAKRGDPVELAINVSGRSLKSTVFVEAARKLLSTLGPLRPNMLLEVTETAQMDDLVMVNKILERFRADGVRVCLDDFGAGAACFPYLQTLTVDYVKVDGAYVKDVLSNERDYAIVKSMVSLCASLKIETVAERVETYSHAMALRQLGIHYGQGWYYGKPSPDPEIPGDFKLRLAHDRKTQSEQKRMSGTNGAR